MKIKLLKNHVLGKQGDIIKANYHRAKYLIAMGVALEHKQTKVETGEEIIDKENSNGSNTKKRTARKRKTNAKP